MNGIISRFDEENVSDITMANISYFSESGIWLGKILANGVCSAKFANVFPHHKFALYGDDNKRKS